MTEAKRVSMLEDGRDKCSKMQLKNLTTFMNPEANFAIGWNRFNLRFIGLWPYETRENSLAGIVMRYSPPLLAILIFNFIVLPQLLALIFYNFILDEVIQIIAAVVGIVGAIIKILVHWSNREVLTWCLTILAEDWMRKLEAGERHSMMKNAKLSRKISIGFSILMQFLVWSYIALKSLPLIHLDLEMKNSTELGKLLLYPSYFPVELKKPSNLLLMWIGQFLGTFSSTIAYTASDCFVAMLIIHVCGQITILRKALMNLLDNEKSLELQVFRKNLGIIVKRHETIIKFIAVIEDTVNLMLLILTLIYTAQFGLQLFGLVVAVTSRKPGQFPFLQVLFYFSYLNVTIVHLFLYCYVGDMLIDESEALGLASYSCKWYNLSGREAKDLVIVMHRARLPLQLSAGKFVAFSLELFGNVLKTSMSYFSVLLTMKEQIAEGQNPLN